MPSDMDWETLEELSRVAWGEYTRPSWQNAHPDDQKEIRTIVARLFQAGYIG